MRKSKSTHSATLIDALKFVGMSGAEYCAIGQGMITAYTDYLCIGHPVEETLNAQAHIKSLIQSLAKCEEQATITQLDLTKLHVNSGNLQIYVSCNNDVVSMKPDSNLIEIDSRFTQAIKTLYPIVSAKGEYVSVRTILLHKESMFATNRSMLVEKWHGIDLPYANMSKKFCDAILKSGKTVSMLGHSTNSITVFFTDGCWIMGRIDPKDWLNPYPILEHNGIFNPISQEFQDAGRLALGFNGATLAFVRSGALASDSLDGTGASYPCPDLQEGSQYGTKDLKFLLANATQISNSEHNTIYFFGDKLRGCIANRVS